MFCSECKVPAESEDFLGKPERAAFVSTVMKLIDRGQYSKNGTLAWTAASSASRLAYIEPSIVLPMVVNRFQMALDTVRCNA
jgi:proteasome activator subunit 4